MLLNSLSLLYGFFNFAYVKPCKLCFHFETQIYQFYKSKVLFASKPKHYEASIFLQVSSLFHVVWFVRTALYRHFPFRRPLLSSGHTNETTEMYMPSS